MSTRTASIIDVLRPERSLVENGFLVLLGSVFTAIMAQLSVSMYPSPVPITGQTFAVLLCGMLLGSRLGGAALALYAVEGALGLPVFAEFKGGFGVIVGPTGGYILSFPVAAALVGWLAERGWDRRLPWSLGAMALGTAVIFVGGVAQLSLFVGWERVWALGVGPYLPGAGIKMLVAAALLPSGHKLLKLFQGDDDETE